MQVFAYRGSLMKWSVGQLHVPLFINKPHRQKILLRSFRPADTRNVLRSYRSLLDARFINFYYYLDKAYNISSNQTASMFRLIFILTVYRYGKAKFPYDVSLILETSFNLSHQLGLAMKIVFKEYANIHAADKHVSYMVSTLADRNVKSVLHVGSGIKIRTKMFIPSYYFRRKGWLNHNEAVNIADSFSLKGVHCVYSVKYLLVFFRLQSGAGCNSTFLLLQLLFILSSLFSEMFIF